ncbi:TPA: hypothetical protein L9Q09_003309 [Klebsiella pneumoniae]|nr:hypothetical protein [Klebsiella pneumoniae]
MDLDFFKPIVDTKDYHPNFERLLPDKYNNSKKLFNEWASGFNDRDGKLVKEFQTTFNSTFWEVYLHASFKDMGFEIDFSYASPDFNIKKGETEVIIEATICNSANGKSPEWDRADEYLSSIPKRFWNLNKEAMIRINNSIISKVKKYEESYSKLSHVKGKPFVIALAPFEQRFFNLQNDRAIRAVLYDEYVNEDIYLDHPELYPDGPPVENLGFVEKDNGAEIPLGIFNDNQYECVSAIIFNNAATFSKLQALANKNGEKVMISSTWLTPPTGKPEHIGGWSSDYKENITDGLMIFHNPFAINKLDPCVFRAERICQVYPGDKEWTLIFENYEDRLLTRTAYSL